MDALDWFKMRRDIVEPFGHFLRVFWHVLGQVLGEGGRMGFGEIFRWQAQGPHKEGANAIADLFDRRAHDGLQKEVALIDENASVLLPPRKCQIDYSHH
ncbi:MAG: hypothetical protein AAF367_12055 [Pseudomonadota bacterium]